MPYPSEPIRIPPPGWDNGAAIRVPPRDGGQPGKIASGDLPAAGTETLKEPGYRATVDYSGGIGTVDVECAGRGFCCLVSDLPYLLLCEQFKIDQLREEVTRQEAELEKLRERVAW